MTLMNWSLCPRGAMLVSDEIGSLPEIEGDWDQSEGKLWRPCGLRQKAWAYPALGVMWGALNWPEPAEALLTMLQRGGIVPQSVEELAALCTPILADGAQSAPLPFYVLLFGWSFDRDRAVGYRFDSAEGCHAEPLPDGYQILPEHPEGDLSDLKGWIDVTRRQQELDHALPFGERGHLGGRIICHELVAPKPGEGPAVISRRLGTLSGAEPLIEQANQRVSEAMAAHGVSVILE